MTVCELVERSSELRNQVVRVRGQVLVGFEVFAFAPTRCAGLPEDPSWLWLDTADRMPDPYAETTRDAFVAAMQAGRLSEFADGLTWIQPKAVSLRRDDAWSKLSRILDGDTRASVTVVGRFDYVPQARVQRSRGGLTLIHGFGHLGAYDRRILVSYVEAPKRFPDRRWP
jgi:hypothetical protein